jgi:F-type H+-transporting ATPase subunit gamma
MPSLIDLRRRLRGFKSTQQITKAMKMVAASRMRRAHERIINARPYSTGMLRVLTSLARRVDPGLHPLLAERDAMKPGARILTIVVTADKGLAGSFNSNILKATTHFLAERKGQQVELLLVGRKGRDHFKRRPVRSRGELVDFFTRLNSQHAKEIANPVIDAFAGDQLDAVYIVYNEFKSVMAQKTMVEQLLPIPRTELEGEPAGKPPEGEAKVDYLYEPDPAAIFATLLPRYVESRIFHALLESNAAFYAAQMTAMESATKNSAEMIESLTLNINKVRQAAITREIIEVVSGAQAL